MYCIVVVSCDWCISIQLLLSFEMFSSLECSTSLESLALFFMDSNKRTKNSFTSGCSSECFQTKEQSIHSPLGAAQNAFKQKNNQFIHLWVQPSTLSNKRTINSFTSGCSSARFQTKEQSIHSPLGAAQHAFKQKNNQFIHLWVQPSTLSNKRTINSFTSGCSPARFQSMVTEKC